MTSPFNHGVRVTDNTSALDSIAIASDSVIGIIGTAENADPTAFPLNTPVAVTSRSLAKALRGTTGIAAVGDTLPEAVDSTFDQCTPYVVVVRVAKGTTDAETAANVLGSADAGTGVYVFQHAQSILGQTPRLLCAPGFTSARIEDPANPGQYLTNPIIAALVTIAGTQHAVAIIDGPNTNETDALAVATQVASKRAFIVDPTVYRTDNAGVLGTQPSSAAVAGLVAFVDQTESFSVSPSNHVIQNILGTGRPIDYSTTNPSCRATLLNAGNVATIINDGGLRLWGNRCTDGSFLAVVRTNDVIDLSLQSSVRKAVDMRLTKTFFSYVTEEVNAFLRGLKLSGDIVDGTCRPDPDLNTPTSLSQGKAFFNIQWTPCYPAEDISFTVTITNQYLSEVL